LITKTLSKRQKLEVNENENENSFSTNTRKNIKILSSLGLPETSISSIQTES